MICGCGQMFFGSTFTKHLKECTIVQKLVKDKELMGGTNEVGRWKRGAVTLTAYQDLLENLYLGRLHWDR